MKSCCEGRYGLFFKYKCYLCNAIPMIFLISERI